MKEKKLFASWSCDGLKIGRSFLILGKKINTIDEDMVKNIETMIEKTNNVKNVCLIYWTWL